LFNVEADGYRPNNRRKTLVNSETENTQIHLCDCGGVQSWKKEDVILGRAT
jgi:hypothetical protein